MGVYAESRGVMVFESKEDAANAAAAIDKWNASQTEDNDNSFPYETDPGCSTDLRFTAYSDRIQNLSWRLQQILDIVKPFNLVEFDAPVMTESEDDSVHWDTFDD